MNYLPNATDETDNAVSRLFDFVASLNGARIMSGQDSFSGLDALTLTIRLIADGNTGYTVTADEDEIRITGLCPSISFRVRDDGMIKMLVGSNSFLIDASKESRAIMGPEGTEAVFKREGNELIRMKNQNFIGNLCLIDTGMPLILSELASLCTPNVNTKIDEVTEKLAEKDPLGLDMGPYIYEFKIKMLLIDCVAGMKADEKWHGEADMRWGFIHSDNTGTMEFLTRRDPNELTEMLYRNATIRIEEFDEDAEKGVFTRNMIIRLPGPY